MESNTWELRPDVKMSQETLEAVAQIACALKSLSAYTSAVIEHEDCPEDLERIVDDGVKAIGKIFVW